MDIERFSALSAPKKMWLVLNYVGKPKLLGSAVVTLVAIALLGLALNVVGAMSLGGLGTSERYQVKLGSPEEKMITDYVNMMGFESDKSYERYAKAAREAHLDSAWVPSHAVTSWLDAGWTNRSQELGSKSETVKDLDPSQAGYYQRVASEWAQYKKQLRSAAGPAQRCGLLGSIVAGFPWVKTSNQPVVCQAMNNQYGVLIGTGILIGAGFTVVLLPFFVILLAREMLETEHPDWGIINAIGDYPEKQKKAFEAWLKSGGSKSLSHLERHQFALSIWRPQMKKGSRLKRHETKRL